MNIDQIIKAFLIWLAFTADSDNILVRILEDWSMHFLLAFLVGFSVYLLTRTILSAGLPIILRLTRGRGSWAVGFIMDISPVLLALSLGLLSHFILDYGYLLWVTPLNPSLDLR